MIILNNTGLQVYLVRVIAVLWPSGIQWSEDDSVSATVHAVMIVNVSVMLVLFRVIARYIECLIYINVLDESID